VLGALSTCKELEEEYRQAYQEAARRRVVHEMADAVRARMAAEETQIIQNKNRDHA
jgi:hypothetical protein